MIVIFRGIMVIMTTTTTMMMPKTTTKIKIASLSFTVSCLYTFSSTFRSFAVHVITLKSVQFVGESRPKSEKERGMGLGRGLSEPLSRKFSEFQISNRSIWCIVEREILKKSTFQRKQKNIQDE